MGNKLIVVGCILSIVGLESYALHQGIDGKALSLSIGSITGVIGYFVKKIKNKEV